MTQEEFSRAAQTYGDMIYRVAYHALGCREDAEDVMQTVLLRLFEQKAEFESEDHMKHWLLRGIGEREPQNAPLFLAAHCRPAGGMA